MPTQDAPVPRPHPRLVDEIDRLFPRPAIRPGTTIDRLMFEAGARAVVDELRRRLTCEAEEL